MTVRVGVNGFGRIGRNFWRAVDSLDHDIEIVAVNDLTDTKTLAHLLKYDSVLGKLPLRRRRPATASSPSTARTSRSCPSATRARCPGATSASTSSSSRPASSPRPTAPASTSTAGAKKVIISAPATGEDLTVVMGVNDDEYDGSQNILSNASCTTNCVAPMAKVLHENFGIVQGLMTTIHAYTNDQVILDFPHKDLRRARAAAINIIPTTTGAAKATALVLPELKGKLHGYALRVPVPTGSVTDLTVELAKSTTVDEVNAAFKAASPTGPLAGLLVYSTDPIVSTDIVGAPASCTFDSPLTIGARRQLGQGRRLVRQRVGLLEPAGGLHRHRRRQALGLGRGWRLSGFRPGVTRDHLGRRRQPGALSAIRMPGHRPPRRSQIRQGVSRADPRRPAGRRRRRPHRAGPLRPQRPARRQRRSPTTAGSGPRCRPCRP